MFEKMIGYFGKPHTNESLTAPANEVEYRCDRIAWEVAAANREGSRRYGAQFSGIRVGPRALLADVQAFETRYGVQLPHEYRAFLMRVGNGVAAGHLGLVAILHEHLHPDGRAGDADFLSESFPFETAFSPFPEYEGEPYLARGTIWLGDAGCGMYAFLVVSGATAGQVWLDHLVDGYGLVPSGLSFLDWIEAAINEKTASLRAGKVFNLKRADGKQYVCIV
jgi:SMI1 / KNR4 family (SUKH-1)